MNDLFPEKERERREPWELFSGYTYGYNPPLFSSRVQGGLMAIRAFRGKNNRSPLHLVGQGSEAGTIALAVQLQAGAALAKTVAVTGGFRFASVSDFADPMFLPGAIKYGDLDALVKLAGENTLWLDDGESSPKENAIKNWISPQQ